MVVDAKGTTIKLTKRTTNPINDNVYIYRIPVPCKKMSVSYTLEGKARDKYELVACAFGFNDKGESSPGGFCEYEAVIKFDNWIYPLEGVAIIMQEIKSK